MKSAKHQWGNREPPHWRVLHFVFRRPRKDLPGERNESKIPHAARWEEMPPRYPWARSQTEYSDNCVSSKETKYPPTKSPACPSIPTGSPRKETFAMLRSPFSIWLSFSVLCDR